MKRSLLFIPYYNDSNGFDRSIESLPNEADIDLLIIDDGSKEKFNINKIQSILQKKKINFNILTHSKNQGITNTRNHALKYLQGKHYEFLIFLDCGDTISSERINLQTSFLDDHSDSMIVGSNVHFVDNNGNHLFHLALPTSWKKILRKMYFNSMLIQPAVTMRTELLKTFPKFPTAYHAAEDYAYFMAVAQHHRVDNIPKYLTTTYINLNGISNTKRKTQIISRIRIIVKYFRFGYYPIVGLLRSILLLFVPLKITAQLKGILYSNESKN